MSQQIDPRIIRELIRRDEAKIHMENFVPYVTEGLHSPAPHHKILCRALDACIRGQKKRLIIAMPPAHAKSVYSSHNFPAFWLGNKPTDKIIAASHTQPFAAEIGGKVRNLINSEFYRRLFEIQISPDTRAKDRWDTTAGGEYYTTGVGGSVVGRRANLFLVDDPYKSKQVAYSAAERKRISDWFFVDVIPRMLPGGVVVIIATRWHEDDLTGEVLKKSARGEIEPFELISLPALCEEPDNEIEKMLGRQYGDALWPEMYPVESLVQTRGGMVNDGSEDEWNALYQQKPRPAESGEVSSDWFQYYDRLPDDEVFLNVCSWDTATTVNERSDFTVGLAISIGLRSRKFYLRAMYREQAEFHTLMRDVPRFNADHNAHAVLIENKGSGQSLIQVLNQTAGQNIIPIQPQKIGDKQWRFELAVPAMEAKRVYLPRRADWVSRFLEELMTFPNGVHDDIVDAFSQAINHFGQRGKGRSMRPLIGA